ncbi:MAG: tetratricopeptide repeat protein, partial [Elusimicrobiota bacterium]
ARFLNENLMTGLILWNALVELGISYLQDPVNPYSVVKSTRELVLDTVQFPRNTLKLKSGDCDDLTALLSSLFENSGLHVAILDYPSHIALMFDTEFSDAREIGIPEEYFIKYNNSLWLGIETTMLGKSFYDSIKQAADTYKKSEKEVRIIDVRNAWSEFEPVTLPDAELDSYPDKEKMNKRISEEVKAFSGVRYEYLKNYFSAIILQNPDDVDANLNLGILYAQYNENSTAKKHFNTIIQKDPFNASALNNLGNISFNEGNFEQAKDFYFKASKSDAYDANIWLNLARASVKLGKKEDVRDFVERAVKLDPNVRSIGDKLLK